MDVLGAKREGVDPATVVVLEANKEGVAFAVVVAVLGAKSEGADVAVLVGA